MPWEASDAAAETGLEEDCLGENGTSPVCNLAVAVNFPKGCMHWEFAVPYFNGDLQLELETL